MICYLTKVYHILVGIVAIKLCSFQSMEKIIYGKLRKDIGIILRRLCEMKDVKIIEVHVYIDHIHMLLMVPPERTVTPL